MRGAARRLHDGGRAGRSSSANDACRACGACFRRLLTIPRSVPYYVTIAALEARAVGEQMRRRIAEKTLARLTQRRALHTEVAYLLTYTARAVARRGGAGRAVAQHVVSLEAAAARSRPSRK